MAEENAVEDVRVRVACVADAAAVAALKAPWVEETPYNFSFVAPTAEEIAEEIERTLVRYPFLVAERVSDDAVLGYAEAEPYRSRGADGWNVELGIYLARGLRGRGLGALLYRELLGYLRRQGVQNAYACVTASNAASLAFHERQGFVEVGRFPATGYKLGEWHETVYLWKSLGDHACPPPAFVSFSQLGA